MSYDMADEWDRYMLRYGGYSAATLDEFMEDGKATYDEINDTYTITGTRADGTIGTWTVGNAFADKKDEDVDE